MFDALGSLFRDVGGSPALLDSVVALLAAFVFSQIMAWAYAASYRGLNYAVGMTHTLILSSMSAALLIVSMRHSWIAGLGLLAALSMIRFRTTLRSPRDLVYLMTAVTVGVACGAGALVAATVGTLSFSLVSIYLYVEPFGSQARYDGILRFRTAREVELQPKLQQILDAYCRRSVLLSVGDVGAGTHLEHSYQIKMRRKAASEGLVGELRDKLSAQKARLQLQDATFEM